MTHTLTLLVSMYVFFIGWAGCPIPNAKPVEKHSTTSRITPSNFNAELLATLVHQKINEIRRRHRKSSLQIDNVLKQAADEQTHYVMRKRSLTHYQRSGQKKTVLDRVKYYGGHEFMSSGENLQYIGIARQISGRHTTLLFPSYHEMADDIVKGWVQSRGHYKNLIDGEFQFVGTSIRYEPKTYRVYATQVFGAKGKSRSFYY